MRRQLEIALTLGLLLGAGCVSQTADQVQLRFEKLIDREVEQGDKLAEEVKSHVAELNELRKRAKAIYEKAEDAAYRFERVLREQEDQLRQPEQPSASLQPEKPPE